MIIDNIELNNFCIYRGKHEITLTPKSKDQPVILIGALNGAGKTTLLDAIQLCLFGPFAQCSKKGKRSYKQYLNNCINRFSDKKTASISLSFRHYIDAKEEHFRVERSWSVDNDNVSETLEVQLNGKKDSLLADNWNSEVSKLFPASIAELFLFDGEKVESYADQKASANMIKTAIEGLLGLDIIEQLSKDLKTFEKKTKLTEADKSAQKEVEKIESEIANFQKKIEEIKQQNAQIFTHKIERGYKKLEELKSKYEKKGGRLYDQKNEIEIYYSKVDAEHENSRIKLIQAAETALPLALLEKNLLPRLNKTARKEEKAVLAKTLHSDIKKYNSEILEILKNEKTDKATQAAINKHLSLKEKKLRADFDCKIELNLSIEGIALLNTLALGDLKQEIKIQLNGHKDLKSKLDKYKTELASIPEKSELSELIEKIEHQKKAIHIAQGELDRANKELASLNYQLERKQSELKKVLSIISQKQIKNLDKDRLVKYSRLAADVTNKYKQRIIEKHINSIQSNVLECYKTLLRKEGLIDAISIDPNTFELKLYQSGNQELHANDLSAGERQILAISMLWGLAKTSGRALPTAIDTPMGRLDTAHRSKLVNRYFPKASHQVILLSTDEEIVGRYLQDLTPYISRKYLLEYNNTDQSTKIVSGYFYEGELADVA